METLSSKLGKRMRKSPTKHSPPKVLVIQPDDCSSEPAIESSAPESSSSSNSDEISGSSGCFLPQEEPLCLVKDATNTCQSDAITPCTENHVAFSDSEAVKTEANHITVPGLGKVIVIEPIDLTDNQPNPETLPVQDQTPANEQENSCNGEAVTKEETEANVPPPPKKIEVPKDNSKFVDENSGATITFVPEVVTLARQLALQAQTGKRPTATSFKVFTKDTLEALLRYNKRPVFWGQNKRDLTLLVLEYMVHGVASKCPQCQQGYLRISQQSQGKKTTGPIYYWCPGATTDGKTFTGCDYKADVTEVERTPWKSP